MKVLTIDRSKWRTGSGDPRVKTGVGVTSLKNEEALYAIFANKGYNLKFKGEHYYERS